MPQKQDRVGEMAGPAATDANPALADEQHDDDSIRARFMELVRRHSQAEIARKTGYSPQNIHRFVKGGRIPAAFCAALSRDMDVNSAWLVSGTGAPYLSDMTAPTLELSKSLLELVRGLGAVERVRMGALAGKEHMKVLRELSDALQAYERLKGDLNRQTLPVYKEMLSHLNSALNKRDLARAGDLLRVCEQVSRLCDAPNEDRILVSSKGSYEYLSHRGDQALEYFREGFQRSIANPGIDPVEIYSSAWNYALMLRTGGRVDQALRVCETVLALLRGIDGRIPQRRILTEAFAASLDISLGRIKSALPRLQDAATRLSPDERGLYLEPELIAGLFYSGFVDARTVHGVGAYSVAKIEVLMRLATWPEDVSLLEEYCTKYIGEAKDQAPPNYYSPINARYILKALQGANATIIEECRNELRLAPQPAAQEITQLTYAILLTQVAWLLGRTHEANNELRKADEWLCGLSPDIQPSVLTMALHYRQALRQIPPDTRVKRDRELRARAEHWVKDYLDKGYYFLRPVMALLQAPATPNAMPNATRNSERA